ncbi:MAG: hypothetical protein FJX62_13445 [Alphaproteobacteria bacterium]|nr:hypothetical protein [Alphaproteobacteria bacterium]
MNRGRVHDIARSRPDDAFSLARTIPDGWYRCQAMTAIAEAAPDGLADKAFKAAREAAAAGEDAYQQTAVLAVTLHAAIKRGRGKLVRDILGDILARTPSVEPMASRAAALGWLWAVVKSAGTAEMRKTVLAAVQAHCHPDRSWRAARLYREMAEDLARTDPTFATLFVRAMPEGKARANLLRRLAAAGHLPNLPAGRDS